jgi:hypothetical protein
MVFILFIISRPFCLSGIPIIPRCPFCSLVDIVHAGHIVKTTRQNAAIKQRGRLPDRGSGVTAGNIASTRRIPRSAALTNENGPHMLPEHGTCFHYLKKLLLCPENIFYPEAGASGGAVQL